MRNAKNKVKKHPSFNQKLLPSFPILKKTENNNSIPQVKSTMMHSYDQDIFIEIEC